MPVIRLGNETEHAHIIYDRGSRQCVLIANELAALPDAVAVVKTMKVDKVWVIAPQNADKFLEEITHAEVYKLYELRW